MHLTPVLLTLPPLRAWLICNIQFFPPQCRTVAENVGGENGGNSRIAQSSWLPELWALIYSCPQLELKSVLKYHFQ